MISAQPTWGQTSVTPSRRPLLIFAFVLISLSGLLAGMALRPLTHNLFKSAGSVSQTGESGVIKSVTSPIPSANPEHFKVKISSSASIVSPGQVVTFTAMTNTLSDGRKVTGVPCTATIDGPNTSTLFPTQATDDNGTVTWTFQFPADASAGEYHVTVKSEWGVYSATWINGFMVK
jgi:hypothetical protein